MNHHFNHNILNKQFALNNFKETSTNNNDNTNNIEYTIMDTSRQIVLYYLFETDIETQDWRENLQL